MRARLAILIAAAGLSLGGCAYNGFGLGVGYGDPYGYGPYGSYGYDPYGYGYGSRIGYGYYGSPYGSYYGSPYWGWYDGFYYPGTGIYVYDSSRNRRVMTDAERQYWKDKFARYRSGTTSTTSTSTTQVVPQENWSGFKRRSNAVSIDRQSRRDARMQVLQTQRSERSQQRAERSQARSERIQSRIDRIQSHQSSDNGHRHSSTKDQ